MFRAVRSAPSPDVDAVAARAARDAASALNGIARDARDGDPRAIRQFLRASAPIIRRICRGVMGGDHSDLEDAIQDCLIDVARALPQFRFESDVTHYVAKISMRRAIAARRRNAERSKNQLPLEPHAAATTEVPSVDAGRGDLVRDLLHGLNQSQSEALVLRLVLGYSMEEIAVISGVSVNTVKTRLRLGKDRLRRRLQRRGTGRV
jgi:RNA polymerase sigma factor (sigma-70 family)